ncbi:RcpC/CpaB family pilus assembly protein [Patulibacter defluvii]|uniref:RcpC/CpaB family pilus assembly protein n=1 Tax=Patulibacter defluvii TaxID=3095358 RepID=UPI002A75F436|nr:RcpC/CpaB family pilus assembly protein [Patulibacter sp. DM4]
MTRRRRALLALGLAIVLGSLAAGDVGRRERALRRAIGPVVPVVVAERALPGGEPVDPARLGLRRVPLRYAPAARLADPRALLGRRPRVSVPAGTDLSLALVDGGGGPRLRPGERIAEIVAIGDPRLVQPGGRVDLLVTREQEGRGGGTRLALEDAEVLRVRPAPAGAGEEAAGERIAVSLRVDVRQAVYLAAAQNFASELRVLPRGADDDRRGAQGTAAGAGLEGVR